jgi:hypothetical protein
MEKMSHEEKVILYVMGILDSSVNTGALRGGRFRLDKAGRKEYEALKASGFHPNKHEIETAYVLLSSPPPEVIKAYEKCGKIAFEWSFAHKWLWRHLKRLFNK